MTPSGELLTLRIVTPAGEVVFDRKIPDIFANPRSEQPRFRELFLIALRCAGDWYRERRGKDVALQLKGESLLKPPTVN